MKPKLYLAKSQGVYMKSRFTLNLQTVILFYSNLRFMKKTILTACFAFIAATCTQAQYFQKLYSDNSSGYNGMTTKGIGGAGHVVGGINQVGSPANPDVGLMVVRTDPDGAFTTPFDFNNTYVLMTGGGSIVNFNCGKVLEFAGSTGFAAMGSFNYKDPSSPTGFRYALAYIQLDPSGNVLALKQYDVPSTSTYSLTIASICESKVTPNEFFATAHFVESNEASHVLVLRINLSGAMIWGKMYDFPTTRQSFETPYDIIESPYGNHEIIVAGDIYYPQLSYPSPIGNGFCLTLDRSSGSVIGMQEFDGGALEKLSAINVSPDPTNPGFILTGYTYDYHTGNCWVLRTTPALTPMWSYLYSENNGKAEDFEGFDVIGRQNTLGNYEYYITGRKEQFNFDAIIMKINDVGIPANPGALFVYSNSPAISQWGNSVDMNTSGTADGVSMYGIWEDPLVAPVPRRAYVVKAYFNGQSGCDESFVDVHERPYGVNNTFTPVSFSNMSETPIYLAYLSTDNNITLCYNLTLPGGDNTFTTSVTDPQKQKTGLLLFPNPIGSKDKNLSIRMESRRIDIANLSLQDMLGREIFTGAYQLDKGENTLQIDISNLCLNKGIYQVVIEKDGSREVIKLIVN
jgi:hypothetical protein